MANADSVWLSVISFFEIGQKVRQGKWPEMTPFVEDLPVLLKRQGGLEADLDGSICLEAGLSPWTHRDPFDRIIAVTARQRGFLLVTADVTLGALVPSVW